MTKLLLVDLDNTIRSPLSGAKFISHPKDQRILPGADKAIAHYHAKGWIIVGITNQGGVAAGFKQLEDAIKEQEYTLQLFPQIRCILFCPDFDGLRCWAVTPDMHGLKPVPCHEESWARNYLGTFRKPGPGMLKLGIDLYKGKDLNPTVWYIGDRSEDEGAAAAASVNYLDAAIWRQRFLPGVHKMPTLSKEQIEFLEGIEL